MLPHCRCFIDAGAYIGLLRLYASDPVIGDFLLKPKRVPRIASLQYGFVDAAGFSAIPLPCIHS